MNDPLRIDARLVRRLVASQFPQWAELSVSPVARSGWDNRTFHLGERMLVRLPSAERYAAQVEKEQVWLPRLAPSLPLPIPLPVAMGQPEHGYRWQWSIYQWLEGNTADAAPIANLQEFADGVADFLVALQRIDSSAGPRAGVQNFHRGGALAVYDAEIRTAIAALGSGIDSGAVREVWESALATHWARPPVWVHGDVSSGNLLVRNGRLGGVIDFGQLGVGDPACDLALAWTLFDAESRHTFRAKLSLDAGTWARGRAWTLWKALIVAAGQTNKTAAEAAQPLRIIHEVLVDAASNS